MGALDQIRQTLRQTAATLGDILLPPRCLLCAEPTMAPVGLCATCWPTLTYLDETLVPDRTWAHDGVRAAVLFDDGARQIVHALKYRDQHEAVSLMGRQTARAAAPFLPGTDLVVPVPLHFTRLWKRRFNQAALIAAVVARQSGKPYRPDVLTRVRATPPQVGQTSRERRVNVEGAFAVDPRAAGSVFDRSVLLVDDVLTTGATVSACAQALKAHGATSVRVAVYALAPPV